ncbi:hypothetical protein EET67_17810 [Pseudaminobacter arsenicus]|uniref:Uncharacterized protein n=1 Tax=Borborobacter arsenicus TaxID=1851146 RepID=A0A432V2Q4_9HYPH|nr:hypothetical protein EET67_17810 [Pseudaminobacter arsenicus]
MPQMAKGVFMAALSLPALLPSSRNCGFSFRTIRKILLNMSIDQIVQLAERPASGHYFDPKTYHGRT